MALGVERGEGTSVRYPVLPARAPSALEVSPALCPDDLRGSVPVLGQCCAVVLLPGPRPWLSPPPCERPCASPRPESPASPGTGPHFSAPCWGPRQACGFLRKARGLLWPARRQCTGRWAGRASHWPRGQTPEGHSGPPEALCPPAHGPLALARTCSAAPSCWLTSAHIVLHRSCGAFPEQRACAHVPDGTPKAGWGAQA